MTRINWIKLLLSWSAIFALFHVTALQLASDRGQAGILVAAIVVGALLIAERVLFAKSFAAAFSGLGFGVPAVSGLIAAIVISVLLLLAIPGYAMFVDVRPEAYPGWASLLPGLFCQAGIAEESLFRGFLYRHVRETNKHLRAAALSAVPFTAVHLILLFTQPLVIALLSILLAVAMSFPLARLFDLGGRTMWAPAIVHFTAQAGVKLAVFSGDDASLFPLVWICVALVVPFLVYVIPVNDGIDGGLAR